MEVGIRELKQHLSEYLDRAERGEVVTVTDRGVPKAMLGPLPGRLRIAEGVADGWITAGDQAAPAAHVEPVVPLRRSADVLGDDRGD
jgi:prevent-host-death family protein